MGSESSTKNLILCLTKSHMKPIKPRKPLLTIFKFLMLIFYIWTSYMQFMMFNCWFWARHMRKVQLKCISRVKLNYYNLLIMQSKIWNANSLNLLEVADKVTFCKKNNLSILRRWNMKENIKIEHSFKT